MLLTQKTTPADPFDRALSLRLDALIITLETSPHWTRRTWLCLQQRWAERRVPAFGKALI